MADGKHLDCSILTPEETIFEGDVTALVAPGVGGYFGILHGHAPLVSALKEGTLKVQLANGETSRWQVGGGFLEVLNNRISVLAESAEQA